MVSATLEGELHEQLERLSPNQQREVVDFARALTVPPTQRGVGANLIKYAGTISEDDLEMMERTIEEGCERVDPADW